jgi:multimeric flavodoxin WrbA
MKIVAITSSPKGKKSNTLQLVNAAAEGAREAGAGVEVIDITRYRIKYCKGCVTCYKKGKCVQKDDFQEIWDKIIEADGIILSSPNYIDGVTAQLKTLFDRMANAIHEQLFDGKYGLTLTTAGGSGDDIVLGAMNTFIGRCGGMVVGSASALGRDGPEGMEAAIKRSRRLGKELVKAIKAKKKYPEQAAAHREWKDRFVFSLRANKEKWAHNYRHWVEKGWIEA